MVHPELEPTAANACWGEVIRPQRWLPFDVSRGFVRLHARVANGEDCDLPGSNAVHKPV